MADTYITEISEWSEQIFQKELTTPVLGGEDGPSNKQAKGLANRSQKIKSILDKNSIFVKDNEFIYASQNIIFDAVFEASVIDGDYVYWNVANQKFYKAIADGTAAQKVCGVADITNSRCFVSGLIPTLLNPGITGSPIYLSSTISGVSTLTDTGISVGIFIGNGIMYLESLGNPTGTSIPSGGIIMWSGTLVTIPSGWYLCDGTNGTPNLIDRFVVQVASNLTNPGASGGSNTHNHVVGQHTLTIQQMPTHGHPNVPKWLNTNSYYRTVATAERFEVRNKVSSGYQGNNQSHNHTLTTDSNLPKYYALAYIMKG